MSGHVAAPPPRSVMMVAPEAGTTDRSNFHAYSERGRCPLWVISGHVQCAKACSLYPPIANAEAPMGRVRYGPKADCKIRWSDRRGRAKNCCAVSPESWRLAVISRPVLGTNF